MAVSIFITTLVVSTTQINCLNINGKAYNIVHNTENELSIKTIHQFQSNETGPWIARIYLNKTYLDSGWDTLHIETNPDCDDKEQAFIAGYLEGMNTQRAIYDHYYNTIKPACTNEAEVCAQVNTYLDTNTQWINDMVDKHAACDVYWNQVNLFYQQLFGLATGYNTAAPSNQKLTYRDLLWINFNLDIYDIMCKLKNTTSPTEGDGHCSVLIKLLKGKSDIVVSHNTWLGYETMRRIIKRYSLAFKDVIGTSISFSGYPAMLVSGDDFMIINSGLVAMETTIGNNNVDLWKHLQPTGQVFEMVRVAVAGRLADGGQTWANIFSKYNSGTLNNQWMIVDMKKFSPGAVNPGLLWIIEQAPGSIHVGDQTEILVTQGYWASYNRPYYPDIFNLTGFQQLVQQYGDFYTHDKTPRALIFKRDHVKVTDVHSMMRLMRSNDFKNDPLSRCDCDPPYSAENAIAARSDLNVANGTYPIKTLGHRPSGATDAKVTDYQLSKSLQFWAVSGPTRGTNDLLPPFQWSKSNFQGLSHRGHPDLWCFDPIIVTW